MKMSPEHAEALVQKALELATVAHKGQVDKAGKEYISHPIAVAEGVKTPAEKMVALLHDTVEDTDVTLEDLKNAGFPAPVVEAVALMTHEKEVPYMEYVARIKTNAIARAVKISDLKQNLNLNRIAHITPEDIARCHKYLDALELLLDIDVLEIEFFDGHEEIDPNAYYWDYVNLAVKLMINGKDLADYIAEETKEKTDHAGWYAHGKAEWVLSDLPVQPGEVNDMFMPFTCPSCGEPGCCRFDGRIRCDEQYVYWYDFQSMEMPKSEVAFRFARMQYEKVVQAAQKELNSKLQLQYVQSIWEAFKENNREYFEEKDMDMFLQRQDVYECIWDYYEENVKWDTAPLLYELEEMYGTVDKTEGELPCE